MGVIKIFLQGNNVDVKKDIVDKYLQNVSGELKNNPQFESQLYEVISFLTRRKSYNDPIPPLDLSVSDDGKVFMMGSAVRPSPDCGNEMLQNNKNYSQVKFSVGENGIMEVTKYDGTFYRFDDYMRAIPEDSRKSFSSLNSSLTHTIISVFHDHRTFLASGIEVEHSIYSDQVPLIDDFNDEQALRMETNSCAPREWNFNIIPSNARLQFRPVTTKTFRYIDKLGLVDVITAMGDSRGTKVVRSETHTVNTEYPDIITYESVPLTVRNARGEDEISEDYQEEYPGMRVWEIEREVNKRFLRGISTSKTRDIRPEVSENLTEAVKNGLVKRYNVPEDELDSSMVR